MIVNHKYKFIFIKTRKTASTSIEIALSQFCESKDIITPIIKEDESIRQALGFRGPQNYLPMRFFNHAGASFIRRQIGEEIWNSYFKFCFERNPFDKAISRYYWSTHEPRPEIGDYLDSAPVYLLSNWEIYTINSKIAVDFVGRYEALSDDMASVMDKLGLPGELSLPKAKVGYRKNRQHYSQVLCRKSRARIELVCAKEIEALGYRWHDLQND